MEGAYLVATSREQQRKHYSVKDINIVANSAENFQQNLRYNQDRTLYLCHSSREDIAMSFLKEYHRKKGASENWEAALVVCGTNEHPLSQEVLDAYSVSEGPPMLVCKEGMWATMEHIMKYTPKQ
mgnify:CR=1 FL=1